LVQVKHDRFNNIDVNHTEKIGSNHTETIGANHKQTIGMNQAIKVGMNLTETVGMGTFQNVGLAKVTTVGLGFAVNVGAGYSVNVGGLANFVVGGAYNEQVGKSRGISAGDDVTVKAGKTMSLTGVDKINANGKEVFIEGSTKLVLAVGASTITMTPGEININAPMIKINCPAAPSSALAATAPDKETTGLGPEVDDIAAKSPTLQKDLAELRKDGWVITFKENSDSSILGYTSSPDKVIVINSDLKSNPEMATGVLAHEVGHAKDAEPMDWSSRDNFIKHMIKGEGEAELKAFEVRREILGDGGPDIDKELNVYADAYDQYLKDGNRAAARDKISQIFDKAVEPSSAAPGSTFYTEHYGNWYDSVQGAKP